MGNLLPMGYLLTMANRHHILILMALASLGLFAGGCAQAPLDYPRKASFALADPHQTMLGRKIRFQEIIHPSQSGYSLLYSGYDAFVGKAVFINAAEKTVDAQYFIFADDLIGNMILQRMFAAADRGVRVRLLVDDWNLAGKDRRMAAIAAHPNIEVRLFNPIGNFRSWSIARPLEYFFGPVRIKRRMHNKGLIIDNTVAFVGGRDIADEYFTARDDFNYRDMDLMAFGPIARQVSAAFDQYWNDRLAIPIEAFVSGKRTASDLDQIRRNIEENRNTRQQLRYLNRLRESKLLQQVEANDLSLIWAKGQYICDPPAKIASHDVDDSLVASKVNTLIESSDHESLIISPYVVPGKAGIERFSRMKDRGLTVRILTNSLATSDYISAYGGYEWYRKDMLREGVELFEIKPDPLRPGRDPAVFFEAPLHTKCFVADRQRLFIGSLNFDLRSARLDTQDGIILQSDELSAQAAAVFDKSISWRYSYRVALDPKTGRVVWLETKDGQTICLYREPKTGAVRRFEAWLLSFSIPEGWL
jgi:putative cardiolipin synthase